jgi:hypothetical protein
MERKTLFKNLAYLIALIFFVNYLAINFYWYYSVRFFDMFMHFLGGFWVGLFLLWFLFEENFSKTFFLKIVLGVLLVGGLWEVYEVLINNIYAQNPFDALDTASDIFFDLSGGLCAILYLWKNKQR